MSEEWENWLEKTEKKDSKKERRILSKNDRSRFKKTDKHKFEKSDSLHENIKIDPSLLQRGRVIAIPSQGVTVDVNGELITCQLRGLLKRDMSQDKNLLVVGDYVLFEALPGQEGFIHHVESRTSVLSRQDNLSRKKQQLIAANIDKVMITLSVVLPALKPFIVDRYIIASRKGNMEPIVVINKIDLLPGHPDEEALSDELVKGLKQSGIKVFAVSSETGQGMEELLGEMKGCSSVFSGQSGVGKSSLINKVLGLDLKVGKATEKTMKGAHTTSLAKLIPIPTGGFCIDTPGIRSFGVWNLSLDEIRSYFPEIDALKHKCEFPDCTHTHETDCAVLKAVKKGKISALRYESYVYLLNSMDDKHARR